MANIKSAKKRARQNIKRRTHNIALRSRMRTAVKKVLKALAAGDKATAETSYREAVPEIDRMVTKGLIRKNRAAQYKSRLNNRLRALS